jgi:metal-sulfur cluster biosynthetic enzyme
MASGFRTTGLESVIDPELGQDLVSLGMNQDVQVHGGLVQFTLRLTTPAYPL